MKTKSAAVQMFVNPSIGLIAAAESVLGSGYKPTCRIQGEEGLQYDQGYYWAEIRISEQVRKSVHVVPETLYRHEQSMLAKEYHDSRIAKGLPQNAPMWARVENSRRLDGDLYLGIGVEVFVDGDFKVIQLLCGKNEASISHWHEQQLFATKDGNSDDTQEYRKIRLGSLKSDEVDFFMSNGLTEKEAEWLFATPKGDRVPGQKNILLSKALKFRALKDSISGLVDAKSKVEQTVFLAELEIADEVSSMTYPQIQTLAKNALRIFYGLHWIDFSNGAEKIPSVQQSVPKPAAQNAGELKSEAPRRSMPVVERRSKHSVPKPGPSKDHPVTTEIPKTGGWSPSHGELPTSSLGSLERPFCVGPLLASVLNVKG